MKPEKLAQLLTDKGYMVKSIRVFKKSFHVNYWTSKIKCMRYCKYPIEKLTDNEVKSW